VDRSPRHGPNRLLSYQEIHETVIGQFLYSGVVEEDRLEWLPGADGVFLLEGELLLRERRIKVTVTKLLEVVDGHVPSNPLIQTSAYSYNVSIVGHGNIFRYCSPHDIGGAEHHFQHHRHQYAPFSADVDTPTVGLIEDGDWPTLGEVIQEAEEWYWENLNDLDALHGG
jgi:hypothetical protein